MAEAAAKAAEAGVAAPAKAAKAEAAAEVAAAAARVSVAAVRAGMVGRAVKVEAVAAEGATRQIHTNSAVAVPDLVNKSRAVPQTA